MKVEFIDKLIFLLLSGAAIFLVHKCSKRDVQVKTEVVKIYDTVTRTITVNNTDTISKTVVLPPDTVMITKHDTVEVIRDYFTEKVIKRSWEDTNLTATLIDTLYKNEVRGSKFNYQILRPQQIITNTTTVNNKAIGTGVNVGANRLDLEGYYRTNRLSVGVGYNVISKSLYTGLKYELIRWE